MNIGILLQLENILIVCSSYRSHVYRVLDHPAFRWTLDGLDLIIKVWKKLPGEVHPAVQNITLQVHGLLYKDI